MELVSVQMNFLTPVLQKKKKPFETFFFLSLRQPLGNPSDLAMLELSDLEISSAKVKVSSF
jgi:hypothetical protein